MSAATTTFQAKWIVPVVGDPIRDGYLTVDAGGHIRSIAATAPGPDAVSLGRVALLPALVNAHTHLELSHLHGSVPPSQSFNDWVNTLMARRRDWPESGAPAILDAARRAIDSARATGTGVIGDVSNTLAIVGLLTSSDIAAHVFYEQIGFNLPDVAAKVDQARDAVARVRQGDERIRVSLAAHAPYSVSPALFRAIRMEVDSQPDAVTTVHLGESPQEIQLLRDGTGQTRAMLERLGVWTDEWTPPGVSPVTYLADLGFLDARTLIVHGVQFDTDDLARLRAIGATLVSCPRSNRYVGVGSPPLDAFYESGVKVAYGTDSLASVGDLNMFAELAEARHLTTHVPARRLLESATLTGARALGFDREYGSIEPGKRAALLTVQIPDGISDVEEYLVGGIEPAAVSWLDVTIPKAQLPIPNEFR